MRKFLSADEKLGIHRIQTKYSLGDLGTIRTVFSSGGKHTREIELPKLPPQTEYLPDKNTQGYIVRIPYELNTGLHNFFRTTIAHLKYKGKKGYSTDNPDYRKYLSARNKCAQTISAILIKTLLQERRLGIFNLLFLVISKICTEYTESTIREKQLQPQTRFGFNESIRELLSESWKLMLEEIKLIDQDRKRYTPFYSGHLKGNLGETFNVFFIQNMIRAQACYCVDRFLDRALNMVFTDILVPGNSRYSINATETSRLYYGFKEFLVEKLQAQAPGLMDFIIRDMGLSKRRIRYLNLDILIFHPRIIRLFDKELRHFAPGSRKEYNNHHGKPSPAIGDILNRLRWEKYIEDFILFSEDLRLSEIICLLWDRVEVTDIDSETSTLALRHDGFTRSELIRYDFSADMIISDTRQFSILFLDLRGFTAVSDGLISSRDLKESLYYFFDPVMNIIHHFKGTIRYYAGDGILATFGDDPEAAHIVLAMRAAVEIQKCFWQLKQANKIVFSGMGIGIHSGAVDDAYLFLSPREGSQTVIGFNANLAGRLSSGKVESKNTLPDNEIHDFNDHLIQFLDSLEGIVDPKERNFLYDRFTKSFLDQLQAHSHAAGSDFIVTVKEGILSNNGIAMSESGFQELKRATELKEVPRGNNIDYMYHDKESNMNILVRMEGNARFKGLDGHFPIWGVYLAALMPQMFHNKVNETDNE